MDKSITQLPYYSSSLDTAFRGFCDYMEHYKDFSTLRCPDLPQDMPNFAFFGNTGVGKSSLFNAIFDETLTEVGSMESCTRDIIFHTLSCGSHRIRIVDLPGIGEGETDGIDYDAKYQQLYTRIGPQVNGVFWVLSNERSERENTAFILDLMRRARGKYLRLPVVILVNKADKINPKETFQKTQLSQEQLTNFSLIQDTLADQLKLEPNMILPVSAKYKIGIKELLPTIFKAVGEAHTTDTQQSLWS